MTPLLPFYRLFQNLHPEFITIMFDELCDETHDAHTMKVIHRACLVIMVTFVVFGGYAISTRLGADAPPSSVTYGTQKAGKDAAVFND